jgi:centromeric protein E
LKSTNGVVKDLLASKSAPPRLLDDIEKITVVDRLREEVVRGVKHLREVILRFVKTVESHPSGVAPGAPASSLVASLNFVDLVGSERASQTHADGIRLKEGPHINRGVLTVSTCIRKLSGGSKKGGHVPYRDFKLARILQH